MHYDSTYIHDHKFTTFEQTGIYSFQRSKFIFYNEEPNPEYAPYRNKLRIVRTAKPPTKPTSHKGIRPVFDIKSS